MKTVQTEFGLRIEQALEAGGLNQTEVAQRLSVLLGRLVRPSAVQYLASKAKASALTADIAKMCGVEYEWLAHGTPPMVRPFKDNSPENRIGNQGGYESPTWVRLSDEDLAEMEEGREPPSERSGPSVLQDALESLGLVKQRLVQAPIVGTASLGFDGFWSELEYPVGHGDGHVMHPSEDRNAYALMVKGDSMYPAIRSGFIVIVEPNTAPVVGEFVVVKLKDGRSTVKELLWQRGEEYTLQAVNGQARMTVRAQDIEFVHYVAAIVPPSRRNLV